MCKWHDTLPQSLGPDSSHQKRVGLREVLYFTTVTCNCKASICFSKFFLASSSSSCCSCRLFFSSSSCLILLLRLSFWRVSSWSSSCYTKRHVHRSVWFTVSELQRWLPTLHGASGLIITLTAFLYKNMPRKTSVIWVCSDHSIWAHMPL